MSAIASFVKMPKSALEGLRVVAVPQKGFLGLSKKDIYGDYLKKHGEDVVTYQWSGFVLAVLLPYLADKNIDLMQSEYDDLSSFLTETRSATHFIFTHTHKQSYLSKLAENYSEDDLRDYFNEFNGTQETEIGKPMKDGISALYESLKALDESSVIVFSIE